MTPTIPPRSVVGAVPAVLPPGERERLSALFATGLLDSEPEALFDNITELAATIAETPISLVSLVDADRQWFKSAVGLAVRQTPRELAFCAHAILAPDAPFIVEDTFTDQRFVTNPLVTGAPFIRFYAGIPLVTEAGQALGTLCVIDREPRHLTDEQLHSLRSLAALAAHLIDVRLHERRCPATASDTGREPSRLEMLATFEAMFAQAAVGVVVTGADGVVNRANAAFGRMVGVPAGLIEGRSLREFAEPGDRSLVDDMFTRLAHNSGALHTQFQGRLQHRDASVVHVSLSSSCMIDDHNGEPIVVTLVHDVTDHVMVNNELTFRATHDTLTGLANRGLFTQHLNHALERLHPGDGGGGELALMFLDLDDFKLVNDRYGHRAGDIVLQEVAARVSEVLGPNDVAARFGGDEFTVMCHVDDQAHALTMAAALANALETPIEVDGGSLRVSMSIGIGVAISPTTKPGDLLHQADIAMYRAKAQGNGGVALYSPHEYHVATSTLDAVSLGRTQPSR